MPACWQNMTEPQRRLIVQVLDGFTTSWSKGNLKEILLLGFVKLGDIKKLRGCYFAAKEEPPVFTTPVFKKAPPKKQKLNRCQWDS